jgi:tetratricopeptide (TPR) repeat protein
MMETKSKFQQTLALVEAGEYERALKEFHELAEETSDKESKLDCLFGELLALTRLERTGQARTLLQAARQMFGDIGESHARGDLIEVQIDSVEGKWDDALNLLQKMAKRYRDMLLHPQLRDVYEEVQWRRGMLLTSLGQFREALPLGQPLWDVFAVEKPIACLYLIPEASDASFKGRLGKMRITQDKHLFRYRTITQGMTRPLSDPLTVAMIQQLQQKHEVLVIVDTAVRFFRGGDENAAKENNLVQDSDMLRSIDANVLFLHHSPKATKDAAELTLENALRGTGDFGAMADFVYAFRRDEKMYAQGEGPEEIEVVCVKPRDFEPPLPFRLQLKRKARHGEEGPVVSVIDKTGDLAYIGNAAVKDDHSKMLAAIFRENPFISFNDLVNLLKMKRELVRAFCKRNGGWKQVEETFVGSKGRAAKRKRWTQGLVMVMAGQVEQTDSAPGESDSAPGDVRPGGGNTVNLEASA